MSSFLHSLVPGDSITVYGPMHAYKHDAEKYPNIVMMAAGTGINPVYQLLLHLLNPASPNNRIILLYASHSPSDILLRAELDELAKTYPEQLKVHYTVSDAPASWKSHVGKIDLPMIQHNVDLSESVFGNAKVLICGPPGFEASLVGERKFFQSKKGLLHELGFKNEHITVL
ncbi:NADH-cytochrome b5 reductase [Basidiobolus ranarum]|uniref:NADH-cytochrome b5 reductase n=1 Tax=Basidiobolus ranarum TaxID=34480 RepID=A0ABR2WD46_9FUNG